LSGIECSASPILVGHVQDEVALEEKIRNHDNKGVVGEYVSAGVVDGEDKDGNGPLQVPMSRGTPICVGSAKMLWKSY
jgi:hypothetical protein